MSQTTPDAANETQELTQLTTTPITPLKILSDDEVAAASHVATVKIIDQQQQQQVSEPTFKCDTLSTALRQHHRHHPHRPHFEQQQLRQQRKDDEENVEKDLNHMPTRTSSCPQSPIRRVGSNLRNSARDLATRFFNKCRAATFTVDGATYTIGKQTN